MRQSILLLLTALLSVPAFAQDDQADQPSAADANAPTSTARGVGARTTYEQAAPNMGPDSADGVVSPMQPMRPLRGAGAPAGGARKSLLQKAADAAGAGAGGGGVTCNGGGCEITATTPYKMETSNDLASMKLHAGAHGGMIFGPDNGYSVGFFAMSDGSVRSGVILGSMPAFYNQGCALAYWVSAKPGGAPLVGSTWKEAVSGGCAGGAAGEGDGEFMFSSDPMKGGCTLLHGVRAYLNVVPNMPPYVANQAPWWGNHPDMNGKFGWRQVMCEEAVSSPLGGSDPGAAPAAGGGGGAAAGGPIQTPRPPCNVCAYADRSTGSCISCNGSPVNCNICPAGTQGPL